MFTHLKISFAKRPPTGATGNLEAKKESMIIMAKGPPNDGARGFEDGWRDLQCYQSDIGV